MKKLPSLRRRITLSVICITAFIAIAYGLLLQTYLVKGLDSSSALQLRLIAAKFDQDYKKDKNTPLFTSWPITAYLGVENLPPRIRRCLPANPEDHTKFVAHGEKSSNPQNQHGDFILISPYKLHTGETLYVTLIAPEEFAQPSLAHQIDMLYNLAIPIGAVIMVIFFFTLQFFMKSLYKPVESLTEWADELGPDDLDKAIPNFKYKEINQLANLLHRSMRKLFDSMQREQLFLRNASHELRTPVAVIHSNIELIDRFLPDHSGPTSHAYDRIRRSASSMKQIIDTLLWLGRPEQRMPVSEPVALDVLVADVIEENRYLLKGKEVDVEMDLQPVLVTGVAHTVKITISNLVRNGFQYTASGRVHITVIDKKISVLNENRVNTETDHSGSEYGYGLGLILVEQITEKSGWDYSNQPIPGGRLASVSFTEPPAS